MRVSMGFPWVCMLSVFISGSWFSQENVWGATIAPKDEVCQANPTVHAGASVPDMESGIAITNPAVLAKLSKFSAAELLFPENPHFQIISENPHIRVLTNDNLFTGRLKSVADKLKSDINSLPQVSLDSTVRQFFNRDGGHPERRFSADFLTNKKSSFVLTGVVNRMDRAYRTVDGVSKLKTCGEIRFLYRFTYNVVNDLSEEYVTDDLSNKPPLSASRLPFTLAVVLDAKAANSQVSCAQIAQRWQKLGTLTTPEEIDKYLSDPSGPLRYLHPSLVDRLEVNLQLFRVPAAIKTDFGGHAEYLLRVFRRDREEGSFVETKLENQIDREKLINNSNFKLKTEFRDWILSTSAIADVDKGVLEIPEKFLATRAMSISPGGMSRTANNPVDKSVLTDTEIQNALDQYEKVGHTLRRVKSVQGFRRRLADFSCTGCHQTRAIAGFHFPGADPASEHRGNAVHVPASAHFFADIPRRKSVIAAFAQGNPPDFSRGFSGRPDEKFFEDLRGTELANGWGAPCFLQTKDRTFSGWNCASGLVCKSLIASSSAPGAGTCVTKNKVRIGDPVEFGTVSSQCFGDDRYTRVEPPCPALPDNYKVPDPPSDRVDYVVKHQGYRACDMTGGFPAGMLQINGCNDLPSEATYGRVATEGFNDCVAHGRLYDCLNKFTAPAGLRACNRAKPCREDYICTAPYSKLPGAEGTCIPPYFVFQFRVDARPKSFAVPEEFLPSQCTETPQCKN